MVAKAVADAVVVVAAVAVAEPFSVRALRSSHRSTIRSHHKIRLLTLCHPEMKADRFSFRKVVLESDREREEENDESM